MSWEELSKGSKMAVMLRGYGSGTPGINARVSKELSDVLGKKNILVTTRAEHLQQKKLIASRIKAAEAVGADDTVSALQKLGAELDDAIAGDMVAAREAMELAAEYSPDMTQFVNRYLQPRAGIVGPDDFREISNIMLENLESRASGMDDYITFWKNAAVKFIEESGSTSIPLRTFDGKDWVLRFPPTVEKELRFWDPKSNRYIKNIVKETVTDDKLLGKMSMIKSRTGYGVSFTHANDSSVLRLMYKYAEKDGIDISSIHDAVMGNLEDITKLRGYGKKAYAAAREEPIIRKTLELMKKEGMSDRTYRQLMKEAEARGLLRNDFTAKDILEEKGGDYFFYGFDY